MNNEQWVMSNKQWQWNWAMSNDQSTMDNEH